MNVRVWGLLQLQGGLTSVTDKSPPVTWLGLQPDAWCHL